MARKQVKEFGRDSTWYFLNTLINAGLGMVAVPLLTKKALSPGEYGIYSLVVTTILFLSSVLAHWIAGSVMRFYAEYSKKGELEKLYSTVFRFVPVIAGGLLLLVPLIAFVLPLGEYRMMIIFASAVFVGTSITTITLGFLLAKQASSLYALTQLLESFGRFALGAILVLSLGFGPEGLFLGWLIGIIAALAIQFKVLSLRSNCHKRNYSRSLLNELWKYGWPIALIQIMVYLLSFSDRYMIQIMRDPFEVGLYSAVYTITTQVFGVTMGFFFSSARPIVLKTWEHEGEEATIRLIRLLTRFFLLVVVPAGVGFFLVRERVLLLFTTSEYLPAESAVLPLVMGFSAHFLVRIPNMAYSIRKKTRRLSSMILYSTLLNIGLNLVMIPRWGIDGAAWATFIAYAFYLVINTYDGNRLLRWSFPWLSLFKVAAAVTVMGVPIFFLEKVLAPGALSLVLLMLAGVAVYSVMLLVLREPGWHEIKEMSRIMVSRLARLLPRASME